MSQKKPLCVSIGPYGATPVEESYRKDLEIVLREALEAKYDYKPFWELTKIDMATDIFTNLIEADLVVVDLRNLNPNVMYELGLRHAFNKPVLHLIDLDTPAPWDIDKNYLIKYQAPLQVSQKQPLIDAIHERIEKIEEIKSQRTPVFNAFVNHYRNTASVANFKGDADLKDILHVLFKSLESVQSEVERIGGRLRPNPLNIGGVYNSAHHLSPEELYTFFGLTTQGERNLQPHSAHGVSRLAEALAGSATDGVKVKPKS